MGIGIWSIAFELLILQKVLPEKPYVRPSPNITIASSGGMLAHRRGVRGRGIGGGCGGRLVV